jgi:hypothetical protein
MLERLPEEPPKPPVLVVVPPAPAVPLEDPSTITTGRAVSLVLFGASVAALAPAIALGTVALSDWDDALARCEGGSRTRCPQDAIDDGAAAYDLGVVSTALFIGAGAVAAGGLVAWLVSPPADSKVELGVQPTAAGAVVTLRGAFR